MPSAFGYTPLEPIKGDSMTKFTGGCLCGQVRYSVDADPAFSGICHCRNCQKFTGSSFEPVLGFPAPAVSVTGDLKTYEDTGDSGQKVLRKFCPNCGSSLIGEVAVMPGVTMILAGSLDEPAAFTPGMEIYCKSAQPWTQAAGERQKFPGMPGWHPDTSGGTPCRRNCHTIRNTLS